LISKKPGGRRHGDAGEVRGETDLGERLVRAVDVLDVPLAVELLRRGENAPVQVLLGDHGVV
jgi:hypothetical protein